MDVFAAALTQARSFFRDAAVRAAHQLGVFAALAAPMAEADLAPRIGIAPRKLRALLDVLVRCGVVRREGGLISADIPPPPIPEGIPEEGWGRLAEVLRSGAPLPIGDEAAYHAHLLRAGETDARELAAGLVARGARRLLDAGGGAGAYTAAFLDAAPEGRATLVDRAPIVALARRELARFAGRVTFVEGDLLDEALDVGGAFDAAVIANVLHLHDEDACARIVRRVAAAVRPFGEVVVKDLRRQSEEGTFFALNMQLYTAGGDVWDDEIIRRWLEDALVVDVRLEGGVRRGVKADPPPAFAEVLRRALALEAEGSAHAAALRGHYFGFMPRQRVEQLSRPLFRTPLDYARLPRLAGAMARLRELLKSADIPIPDVLEPARDLAEKYERSFFSGLMPLLYGTPADLAFVEGLIAGGADFHEVVDRWLAAPFVHEISHLHRRRPALNPYLDECFSGYLGVLALPELAYPARGETNALYAAPWFAQVGQKIARTFVLFRALRAHAGVEPWPAGFAAAAEELYWTEYARKKPLHFLCDAFAPGPWLDLIARAGPEPPDPAFDRHMIEDGLRAMCLRNFRADGTFRVESTPPAGPITIDRERLTMTTVRRPDALEAAAPSYPLPGILRGTGRFDVEIADLDHIPGVASRILATIA